MAAARFHNRSAILTWHSIDAGGSVISTAPEVFRRQIEWLAASGLPVAPLARAAREPGLVALTFDDGFANFVEHAAPLLARHRLPATVFLVSGYSGRDNGWPGQSSAVPTLPLLGWDDARSIQRAGIELGAHTHSHPRLPQLSPGEVQRELERSRREIEDRTGAAVRALAYPYGASSPAVRRQAAALFETCVGTGLRMVRPPGEPLDDLPRLDMYYLRSNWAWLGSARGDLYLSLRAGLRSVKARWNAMAAAG